MQEKYREVVVFTPCPIHKASAGFPAFEGCGCESKREVVKVERLGYTRAGNIPYPSRVAS